MEEQTVAINATQWSALHDDLDKLAGHVLFTNTLIVAAVVVMAFGLFFTVFKALKRN